MKKALPILLITVLILFLLTWGCAKKDSPTAPEPTPGCTPVTFSDSNLEAKIREAIGKPTGDICQSDCESIMTLDARSLTITVLTGLEYCVNLTWLWLGDNSISDISALSGLTNLAALYLYDNAISDISALSGLTNLTDLYLENNSLIDISALSGLTNLTWLHLYNNSIIDISALSGLTNLTSLGLDNNNISDISVLVTNAAAGGLGSGDSINLQANPLGTEPVTDIETLRNTYSVTVYYP